MLIHPVKLIRLASRKISSVVDRRLIQDNQVKVRVISIVTVQTLKPTTVRNVTGVMNVGIVQRLIRRVIRVVVLGISQLAAESRL